MIIQNRHKILISKQVSMVWYGIMDTTPGRTCALRIMLSWLRTWKFFSFKNGRGFKSPTDVFHEAWHMGMASELEAVHGLMNDLERRLCNARAIDEVAVLPGGGGRLVQLNCM